MPGINALTEPDSWIEIVGLLTELGEEEKVQLYRDCHDEDDEAYESRLSSFKSCNLQLPANWVLTDK